jgi:NAD(P)H-dependent FMN reductase
MNVVMLNGSPRGRSSNTEVILNQILIGMSSVNEVEAETFYLQKIDATETHIQALNNADLVIIGFPLYTDGMPGIVKHFIDALVPIDLHGKPIAFVTQSGFPEAKHSRPIARYLEKLCVRINATHAGTMIHGNGEGIRLRPANAQRKLFELFNGLGASLAFDGHFKPEILEKLAGREELSRISKQVMKMGFSNFYWDYMLKKNNAFEKRFDAPYAPAYDKTQKTEEGK